MNYSVCISNYRFGSAIWRSDPPMYKSETFTHIILEETLRNNKDVAQSLMYTNVMHTNALLFSYYSMSNLILYIPLFSVHCYIPLLMHCLFLEMLFHVPVPPICS